MSEFFWIVLNRLTFQSFRTYGTYRKFNFQDTSVIQCDDVQCLRRHVLVSSGPLLTPEQWEVCGVACYRACSNSLQELHQLTMAFSPRSESFYGDVAQVKVAARRDATIEESERLRQLAAQVSCYVTLPIFRYLFVMSTKILHYSGCLTFVVLLCALTIATEIRQLSVVCSTILKPDRW